VLHNLVANALDSLAAVEGYQREIVIDAAQDGHAVKLTIRDNGPGISPAVVDQLFTTIASSKPSGMGLGLAISRSIVESHGGRLWLEQSDGGATFALTLPLAR
jgi:C4-dicarboxylate-specific signal transduction histidine kinase